MDGENNEIGPTRDPDLNRVDRSVYLSRVDQHMADLADRLKEGDGYQITFTVRLPNSAPMNYMITNNFPKDISLKVHKECTQLLIEELEK